MDTVNIILAALVIITTHLLTKIRAIDIRININNCDESSSAGTETTALNLDITSPETNS